MMLMLGGPSGINLRNRRRFLKRMPVNDAMRRVEREIDDRLRELPLWRCAKGSVLKTTLDYYRNYHETISLMMIYTASIGGGEEAFYNLNLQLQRLQAGVFQILKWALVWCPEHSAETFTDEMIHQVQDLGGKYEALVDALKYAKYDQIEIAVDESARQVTVYEGGDVTGADWNLVDHQRRTNLVHSHVSLTEDADQLTNAWTAGAYRRAIRWLGDLAREGQGDTVMFTLPSGGHVPLFSRPTIIRVPEPQDREIGAVLEDLTLTPEKVAGPRFWAYVYWLDTPLVAVGTERLGPSDLLVALAGLAGDDRAIVVPALSLCFQKRWISRKLESVP
jgi:hypothetical protein